MAQKIQVLLEDDLDGGQADETITFGLDGKFYEIDLSASNASAFRENMERYARAGRRAGTNNLNARGHNSRAGKHAEDTSEVRAWARKHGLTINERGRVPAAIYEQFKRWKTKQSSEPADAADHTEPTEKESSPSQIHGLSTVGDRYRAAAKQASRLSMPQITRLKRIYNAEGGRAKAEGYQDEASWNALADRGLVKAVAEREYEITQVGRVWFSVHGISPRD